ncbi:MAG TPA: penicillin acylase family protein [Bacteroidales bacterium]|nr:penicillin acylase family protein [Bacteroidales bacterium]
MYYWFLMPYRINRIREMINAKDKLGTEDFKEILCDFHSRLADRYTDELIKIISTANDPSANGQKALSLLSSWDRTLTAESTATTIFEKFYTTFIKNSHSDELGEDLFKELSSVIIHNMFEHLWRDSSSSWIDNVNTQHFETFDDIVLLSFKETVEWLEKNVDKDPANWKWGNIHQLNLKHFLGSVKTLNKIFGFNKGTFSVDGSFHTVNPMTYSFHNPDSVVYGTSQRHVFNMANLTESYVAIPIGTSGIPASKYYCNQIEMFLNNEFKKRSVA